MGRITAHAPAGSVEIEFGVNRWVVVTVGSEETQQQIGSRRELARYLEQHGLFATEAQDLARSAWKERPPGAGGSLASANDTLIGATGLSSGVVLMILVAFVVITALVWLLVFSHAPISITGSLG
jgi:hypothetical protein